MLKEFTDKLVMVKKKGRLSHNSLQASYLTFCVMADTKPVPFMDLCRHIEKQFGVEPKLDLLDIIEMPFYNDIQLNLPEQDLTEWLEHHHKTAMKR